MLSRGFPFTTNVCDFSTLCLSHSLFFLNVKVAEAPLGSCVCVGGYFCLPSPLGSGPCTSILLEVSLWWKGTPVGAEIRLLSGKSVLKTV